MSSVDIIKNRVRKLYDSHMPIHINVSTNNPKVHLTNEAAMILGVYPHIFIIETQNYGKQTLQYTDLMTKNIEILELSSR